MMGMLSADEHQAVLDSLPEDPTGPGPSPDPTPDTVIDDGGAGDEAPADGVIPGITKEAPAPGAPVPISLKDTDLVTDPIDGQIKPWGEIRNDRLRHADYTRKATELADERKRFTSWAQKQQQVEAELRTRLEEFELAKSMQELGNFPDDDPYKGIIQKLLTEINRLKNALPTIEQKVTQETQGFRAERGRQALQSEEARLLTTYRDQGLGTRELRIAQRMWLDELQRGNKISMEDAVKGFLGLFTERETKAVERFKQEMKKSRPAPKAGGGVAPAGGPTEMPTLKGGGVLKQVRAALERVVS